MRHFNPIEETNCILEQIEEQATSVQVLANVLVLLGTYVEDEVRLKSAVEELAGMVEAKSQNVVQLSERLIKRQPLNACLTGQCLGSSQAENIDDDMRPRSFIKQP